MANSFESFEFFQEKLKKKRKKITSSKPFFFLYIFRSIDGEHSQCQAVEEKDGEGQSLQTGPRGGGDTSHSVRGG